MNHYKNILFDLDGTLIETKPGVISSLKKASEELKFTLPPDKELDAFMGPPISECFTNVCGLDPEQTELAIATFRKYYEGGGVYNAKAFDGIADLLRDLRKAGFALGVATSKHEKFAGIVLRHCGILDYFDTVAGDQPGIPWTKTDSIKKAMADIKGADTQNTVLVGDRKFDALGAEAAGIDSIGILYGYGKADEIYASPFSAVLKDIAELRKYFLNSEK